MPRHCHQGSDRECLRPRRHEKNEPASAAAVALLAGLGFAAGACADPAPPLAEVVVTATRAPSLLVDTPDALVVDAGEIALRQASFAADILRLLPGVSVSDAGAFGGVTSVSLRGAGADKTLVLIDGVVQNDPSSPSGAYDFGGLDLGDIARVEVLEGPQGSLWGSAAIGGVVSLTTREEDGWRLALEGGSVGTGRAAAGAGISKPDWALGASASVYTSDGVSKADGFPETDPFFEWTAGLAGRMRLTPTLSLDGKVRYANSHVDIDGYPPPNFTFGDDAEYATSRSWTGYARASLAASAGFSQSLTLAGYDLDRASLGGPFPSGYHADRADVRWMASRGAAAEPFGLVFGAERDATWATLSTGAGAGLGDTSAFVAGHVRPLPPVSLGASLRYDAPDGFDGRASARGGVVASLPAGFALTGDIGQGFKTPTISEIACDFCFPARPSAGLKPETSEGWDLGLRQRDRAGRWEASVTGFELFIRDQIAFVGGRYVNLTRTRSMGVEAAASLRLGGGLSLRASYTHTDAIDETSGARLPRIPPDAGAASLLVDRGRLSGALTVRAESASPDLGPNYPFGPAMRPALALADVAVAWRLTNHIALTGRITNLADRHYEETLGYGEPRRMILVGVRLRD